MIEKGGKDADEKNRDREMGPERDGVVPKGGLWKAECVQPRRNKT